jgi:hypothetical protein
MPLSSNHRRRIPPVFEPDTRPGADAFVYCKGCGNRLAGQQRHQGPRAVVSVMMCEPCREQYGHQLVPPSGAPSFCYRCGRPDETIVERGPFPATYHVCPHCNPEIAARHRGESLQTEESSATA